MKAVPPFRLELWSKQKLALQGSWRLAGLGLLLFVFSAIFYLINLFNFSFGLDLKEHNDQQWYVADLGLVAQTQHVQPGDRIIRVNGQAPTDPYQINHAAQLELQNPQTGQIYILSKNTIEDHAIFGLATRIACGVVAVIYFVLSLMVYLWAAQRKPALLFFSGGLSLSLTLFYLATIYSGNNGALLPGETAAILATAVLLHFFLIFPGGFRQFQLPFRLSLSSLIWFGYISAVVAISCLIINSFWPGLAALGRSLVYLHLSLITLANLAVVIIKAFRVEGRQARSEIRVITLTLALVCSPLLLLVWLPNLFFPKMETLVNGPELIGILGLLPVGVGYSIVQYKSLGIRNLARRDAARLLLLLLLVLFYVVLLRASEEISVNFSLEAHLFLYAGLGCILAFCFHPLQKKLQKLLDQLLFKDFYDYRKALFNITTKISQQFELENVAWVVLTELTQVFNLEMAALVLYRQLPGQAPDVYYSKYLRHTPNLVQLPLLEAATTLALPQVGRVYLAWSRSGEGPLVLLQIGLEENNYATLVLGSKLNAESLSREDVNLLETLVGSVKISLQKALLLNDLEQKILQLQNYSEQIRLSKDELQKLSQQVIRASEEERVRLACEIHDDPLQRLMLVLRQFDPRDQTITPREQFCWSLVKEVSATLRAICTQLRPPLLDDIGLYPALEALSEQFWRENHLAVCLEVAPQLETTRFPSELEIVLYRVIQEALQNVVKHAQASQAHVKLCHQHDLLTLQVIDNGCGLLKSVEKASLLAQGNLGLVGLRERVQSVGGVFEVSNRQDGGTLLQAQFSLPTALKDADCLSPLSPVETGLSRLP